MAFLAWLTWGAPIQADPLRELVESAWRESPRVAAAREHVLRATAAAEGVEGFFDPRLSARASRSDFSQDLYGLTRAGVLTDDTISFQAGVEAAVLPGLYAGLGVEQWRPTRGDATDREISRVGPRLRIPLLRDRGFLSWRAQRRGADAACEAARAQLLDVTQRLEQDVELRYIELQTAFAQYAVAQAATARAERLFRETQKMAELNAVPAYQVHPARLEIARRREELAAAEQAVRSSRRRIELLTGIDADAVIEPVDFIAWGSGKETFPAEDSAITLSRRGDYLRQVWLVNGQAAQLAEAQNVRRSELSLEAGYSWMETEDGDARDGGDVSLIWRHAIGNRSGKATARAREAQAREETEILRALEREIITEQKIAAAEFQSAASRLAWMADAVAAARSALDAEEERFRLGEGTSRQALDAQKDLTDILRRQNDVVADVLKARARLRFAMGLGGPSPAHRRGNTL